MLDPEEVAAYEVWKEHKLTSSTDLSVAAFNLEMEGPALAYEAGVRALYKRNLDSGSSVTEADLNAVIAANPYRGKGMRGYVPPKKVTGE